MKTAQDTVKVMIKFVPFHELLTCCCTGMDITAYLVTAWTSYDHELPLKSQMNSSIKPFRDNPGLKVVLTKDTEGNRQK